MNGYEIPKEIRDMIQSVLDEHAKKCTEGEYIPDSAIIIYKRKEKDEIFPTVILGSEIAVPNDIICAIGALKLTITMVTSEN